MAQHQNLHHPDCLSLDNVLGKHDCDCKPKGVHGLMHAQMQAEWELSHRFPPWVEDRDPPEGPCTYLTVCQNGDGAIYRACHYWNKGWASPGPFVRVLKWMQLPPL